MKKYLLLVLVGIFSCLQLSAQSSNNASPKHEFRATWFATVTNIDWPTAPNLTVAQQKAELIAILDKLQAGNINAVCLQVRSQGDALYKSSYEPWAVALTGERGSTGPGYDPLEYAIQEAHNRGMELHAWVNPFRMSTTEGGRLIEAQVNSLYKGLSWSWVLAYNNVGSFTGQIIDPGYPEAREYIKNVVMEIVDKYDIDGILMDDYFYPYGGTTTEDAVSKRLYKPNDVKDINGDGKTDDDWRRSNVDALIKSIYDELNTGANKKPWVRFGLAPFGVWTIQPTAAAAYGISLPNGISGQDCYEQLACNPIEWIKNGYIDYVSPQLYWPTATSPNDYRRAQDYHILYNWWSDICTQFSKELPGDQVVQFYPSHSADRVYDSHQWGANEMRTQVGYNQKKLTHGYSGSVFFSTRFYLNLKNAKGEYVCGTLDSTLCEQLHASHYQHKALVPPMKWKSTGSLEAPTELSISGNTLTWKPEEGRRYTIYVYPKEVEMHTAIEQVDYLQRVVYGNTFTLPAGFNTATHNVAVRSYDRYGVEHAATEYTPDVTYVLNGGELGNRTVVSKPNVPTNAELWEAFKPYYNTFYADDAEAKCPRADQPIDKVSLFAAYKMQKIMTDEASEYKWLGDYVRDVATAAGVPLSTDMASANEGGWRWAVHAFFNAAAGQYGATGIDFTEAGKPENWGPAYQAAHATTTTVPLTTLPEKIEGSAFTLPIAGEITHPNGSTFLGWYDNPDMTGNKILALRVGYKGTVYAKWSGITWMLYGGQYTGGTLPSTVQVPYTLPTKTQMQRTGYVFGGWYEKANFSGNVLTSIPANYTGVLHAKWIPAHHVTWHPDHCHDVSNEDLWQLFMEDYNEWYFTEKHILPTVRAEQPITNAIGFTYPPEEVRNQHPEYTNGMVMEFMEGDPKWQWLDDYINNVIDKENESLDSNEPLWTAFKEATGLTNLGALKNMTIESICDNKALDNDVADDGRTGGDILTELFKKEEWQWLKDYIKKEQNAQDTSHPNDISLTDDMTNRKWAFAVAAFFKQSQREKWPYSANFSTAGKPSVWKNSMPEEYHHEMAHFQVTSELEYRKNLHAFFNDSNVVTYPVSGGTKTEGTADFTIKGQPKPNGDPNAGWYSTWSKATFPEYIAAGQALPKVRRDGYVFAGWCCGNAAGYDYNTRMFGSYDETMEGKNHLWARWLELCLYEGYAEKDKHSLQEPDKVNHNVELTQYADGTDTGKSHKIAIHRNFVSDGESYSTLVLPFAIARDEDGAKSFITKITDANGKAIFDENTLPSILKFVGAKPVEVNGENVVNFVFEEQDLKRSINAAEDDRTVIPPYTPFLFRSPVPMPTRTQWWAAFIHDEGRFSQPQMGANGLMFKRMFEPSVVEAPTEGAVGLILVSNNRLAKITQSGKMLGLRGYFIYEGEPANMPSNITIRQETTTDVSEVKNESATEMQVEKILRNGHIYILRNGVTYTITGARVQ